MLRMHEDREMLKQAVNHTSAQLSFSARLVEKDYYASVLLEYLAATDETLVFKGGTCLSKVYEQFFRLSEDLDFTIPIDSSAARSERSRAAASLKKAFTGIPVSIPAFRIAEPLKGANSSSQYIGVVTYRSALLEQDDFIKIEVGLREPLVTEARKMPAHTVLINPMTGTEEFTPISIPCISLPEAFAEKFRAALTRREVAIRDYFDIDYAVLHKKIAIEDAKFLRLVKTKLAVPGTGPVLISAERQAHLVSQVDRELKAVLREEDLRAFDIERAMRTVMDLAARIGASD